MALLIDNTGMISDPRVRPMRFLQIERGPLTQVKGIVVHQTDASTKEATFQSYQRRNAMGAHFLIDKDGMIYETASLHRVTNHIGALRPRCLAELSCKPADFAGVRKGGPMHRIEIRKPLPLRYPVNAEAVGIELVGRSSLPPGFTPPPQWRDASAEKLRGEFGIYEQPTAPQNHSLKWLVNELVDALQVSRAEVFRHPTVSFKNRSEAGGATW